MSSQFQRKTKSQSSKRRNWDIRQNLRRFQQEKEDIISRAVEQMKKEAGQIKQSEKEENIRRQDASLIRLQEMEQKLEKLCLQTEYEDEAEKDEDEIDEFIFTDAWNPSPLCEYAWQMLDSNMSTITSTYVDPNAFAGWVHAIMEDFLASQEQIIGIRGHTRETVLRARARLQNIEIPEHIGLLLLMLRPMRIEHTHMQLVLLPHEIQENQINDHSFAVVEHVCAAAFRDAQVILRPIGGALIQLNAPACRRTNVLVSVTSQYCNTPQNGVVQGVANAMFGTNHLTRQYPPMYRFHLFANNNTAQINFVEVWYDYIYNVSFDHIFEKSFSRSYVMLGSQKEHTGRIVKEIPMRVVDHDNHTMLWNSGVGVKEMVVPWFECDTVANAQLFVQQLRALHAHLNYEVINPVSDRKMKNLHLIEWFLKLKSLAFGDVTKLFAALGR